MNRVKLERLIYAKNQAPSIHGFSYHKKILLEYSTHLKTVEDIELEAYGKRVHHDVLTVMDDDHPHGWLISKT
jgi:hypothetical protein